MVDEISLEQNVENDSSDFDPMHDEELLHECVLALVEHKQDVDIEVKENKKGKLLIIDCHPDDRGRVIGRLGCNVNALKTLFSSVGGLHGRKLVVALRRE